MAAFTWIASGVWGHMDTDFVFVRGNDVKVG